MRSKYHNNNFELEDLIIWCPADTKELWNIFSSTMYIDDDGSSSFSQPSELVGNVLTKWKFECTKLPWQREFTKDIPHFQYHYFIITFTKYNHHTAPYIIYVTKVALISLSQFSASLRYLAHDFR